MGKSISLEPTALLNPGKAAAGQGPPPQSWYPESRPLRAKSAMPAGRAGFPEVPYVPPSFVPFEGSFRQAPEYVQLIVLPNPQLASTAAIALFAIDIRLALGKCASPTRFVSTIRKLWVDTLRR